MTTNDLGIYFLTKQKTMKIKNKVFVINWDKHYEKIDIFPIKHVLPTYCGINYHWKYKYEDNLTLKGTINKREPKKLVEKIPSYKNYKWEVLEIFKHPKAGKLRYDLDQYTQEQLDRWKDYSTYTEENLLLLASTHTDKDWMKCYIVIEETGVSKLTPEQYANEQFNALIETNLGKWNRHTIIRKEVPDEIISRFYDEDDRVLFGSSYTKGLVSYEYLEGKFSCDSKPIYLNCSVLYDGYGNTKCPSPELIKPFSFIKNFIENS